jgi:hypothetical protein
MELEPAQTCRDRRATDSTALRRAFPARSLRELIQLVIQLVMLPTILPMILLMILPTILPAPSNPRASAEEKRCARPRRRPIARIVREMRK